MRSISGETTRDQTTLRGRSSCTQWGVPSRDTRPHLSVPAARPFLLSQPWKARPLPGLRGVTGTKAWHTKKVRVGSEPHPAKRSHCLRNTWRHVNRKRGVAVLEPCRAPRCPAVSSFVLWRGLLEAPNSEGFPGNSWLCLRCFPSLMAAMIIASGYSRSRDRFSRK